MHEEAIKDFSTAIKLSSKNNSAAICYYNRSVVFEYLGNYHEAINDLNKAIEINKDYKNAYIYRAEIYKKLAAEVKDTILINIYLENAEKDISLSSTLNDSNTNDNDYFSLDLNITIWSKVNQ